MWGQSGPLFDLAKLIETKKSQQLKLNTIRFGAKIGNSALL